MAEVAREFSTSTAYAVGDLCIYNGYLYRFTAAHSAGAWNGNAALVDSQRQEKISETIAAYDNAVEAADFGETLVFEEEQITGTRYKYIFTDGHDPRT